MIHFLKELLERNQTLFYFGLFNFLSAMVYGLLLGFTHCNIRGVNAWLKPLKFSLSIGIFSWTMGLFTFELHEPGQVNLYNWAIIILLGFENLYIAIQAGRGKLSHYNVSSPFYSLLTFLMIIAAVLATLWTGYMGILFLYKPFENLPDYYLLSIRLGIFLFVVFAFQGATMGARSSHTVGGPEGGPSLALLNWSTQYGDLRIAHFMGMHSLQIIPLLSWYVLKNWFATLLLGLGYGALALYTLIRALKGKPLVLSPIKK